MTRALIRFALVLCLLVATAAARARDMSGRLGFGGHLDSGPLGPALSLKYWVSDFGLQALFSFSAKHSTDEEAGAVEWRPGVRVLYAMTRARLTNLYAGAGLSTMLRTSAVDGGNVAYFELVLGAEHFFGERLSVAGHVTLSVELGKSPERGLDSGAWGGSFHYYF